MKYSVLPVLLFGFVCIFFSSQADAMCAYNEDWPQAPCLDTPTYTTEEIKQFWAPYYDYKGSEWMEKKKLELINAIQTDTLDEWRDGPDDFSHWNVYLYYSIFDDLGKYKTSETFYENEMLILLENQLRKVYYTGENIISVKADPKTASVIFEASKNAKLDVKAPKVYKVGPDLFVLRNGEEVDAVRHSNECFFYATIETQQPETIEIIFAAWPEYMETVEDCETFTVAPLKQVKLGIGASDIVCKENLELVTKYDSSPACVKPETKQKLIERGWTVV